MPLHRRPALHRLSDSHLHALLARVQTALLNRAQGASGPSEALVVEIVDPAEARLLTLYRALPRARRPQALAALTSLWGRCAVPPRGPILRSARTWRPTAKPPTPSPQPQPLP